MKPPVWPVQDIRVQHLDSGAMAELLSIQDAVCAQLLMPELYFPLTPAEMHELVGPDGVCLGLVCDGGLVGFLGLLFMGERAGNVGQDLGLPSHSLPQVAYLNTINIAPTYQCLGLQRHLQRAMLHTLGAQAPASMRAINPPLLYGAVSPRPWNWLCSTVSPHNLPSLQAHFGSGFRIAGLKPKYRDYMRFILVRGPSVLPQSAAPGVWVDVLDYVTQSDLLARGWTGVHMVAGQVRPQIQYQRLPEGSHD